MGEYFLYLELREQVVGKYAGELGIETADGSKYTSTQRVNSRLLGVLQDKDTAVELFNEIADDGVIWVRERIQQEASQ